MKGALVPDLGLPPGVWLVLTVITSLALFFKFRRFWSIRNLDLMLLFSLTPGLVRLVGMRGDEQAWGAFAWLFLGSLVWLVRCVADLGLIRRPLLEPNLNPGGMICFLAGLASLVLVEVFLVDDARGAARNPGDPHAMAAGVVAGAAVAPPTTARAAPDASIVRVSRLGGVPAAIKRVAAALGHLGIVLGLVAVGSWVFERPTTGLAMAVSFLILPYTRIALIDSGQLVAAAMVVLAVLLYRRPLVVGALLGTAAAWMPAGLGLIPLWAGAYGRRGVGRFLLAAGLIVAASAVIAARFPVLEDLAIAVGARPLAEAGLLPHSDAPKAGSFWTSVDPAYRLPVLILYLMLVLACTFWPAERNLGQLIAQSAALLVASQFWYLDEGGTHIVLYLPVLLMMVFRPNLSTRRMGVGRAPRGARVEPR